VIRIIDGRIYSRTFSLATAGDTELNYGFSTTDGTDEAKGAPTTVQTVVVE
jgi:hypothetical protein